MKPTLVILAAGMGTRLMPLTKDIPKALLKINNISLLERMIKNCIENEEGCVHDIVIRPFVEDNMA